MATVRKSRPREQRSDAARNREALVRAATAAVHRDGPRATMATIAADAGVGIGTLYRHFPTREDLLNSLTHRSFEQVLTNVLAAESDGTTASDALRRFIEAAITQRNELVLPLHGGLPVTVPETLAVRDQVHRALQRIIEMGHDMPSAARHLRQWPESMLIDPHAVRGLMPAGPRSRHRVSRRR
jgi:AcrR family transcriptional regulator